jgi:cytochrome c oxidase accessory protein FixG
MPNLRGFAGTDDPMTSPDSTSTNSSPSSDASASPSTAPPTRQTGPTVFDALRLGENETQPTIGAGGHRNWIYAREVMGWFTRRRNLVAWILLAVYLGVPWLSWDGMPLLQVDVFARRLALFGKHYYAQDIGRFLPGLMAFVVFVFLFTAKWGRVWCGWACPQTVFLQFVFAPVEKWIEGRSAVRRARDAAGFSWDKLWRKAAKHAAFLVIAALIGNTALAYFWGRDNVLWALSNPPWVNPTGFAFVMAFTAVFYWVFAYFKEQACVIVCPYAKFQSVLLDERSLIVGYDAIRGEPRGRGAKREGKGDCVDCRQCIAVCPTGIDIRQGVQLECLHCTRCIDACDDIMKAWKKPAGLIRYASLDELAGKAVRGVRKRLIVYGTLMVVLASFSAWLVFTRPEVSIDVLRKGHEPYVMLGQDSVVNTYVLNLRNKSPHRRDVGVEFAEPFPGRHDWDGRRYSVGSGERRSLAFRVIAHRSAFTGGKREVNMILRDGEDTWKFKVLLVGPFGSVPAN